MDAITAEGGAFMKREDILKTLVNLSLPADEYWVCSGAAMVLYGLRAETADVDLGCTARLADRLESDGFSCRRTGDGNRRFAVGEDVEIFENWRYGSVETVSGFPVVSLAGLREMKSALGREKDIRDIALIDTSRLSGAETRKSCAWCVSDPLLRYYHDTEWGIKQLHDDKKQFEFLTLEAMQCGLSWMTVLKKREAMRAAFSGFDPEKIALIGDEGIGLLLTAPGIIRSRAKIRAMVQNARAFLKIQEEFGSFDSFFWGFTGGKTLLVNAHAEKIPAQTPLSERMSREMKKRGFSYLGPVVTYSHMQAAGMVNDHEPDCFGYLSLGGERCETDGDI